MYEKEIAVLIVVLVALAGFLMTDLICIFNNSCENDTHINGQNNQITGDEEGEPGTKVWIWVGS